MARLNATIENAIIAWISNATGLTAVWDKQRAPRPTLPYALVNLLPPQEEVGMIAERKRSSEDNFTVFYRFLLPVSVNIIGNANYFTMANELVISLQDDTVREDLKTAGLYIRNFSEARDLTALLDSDYEFRVQRDFNFGFTTESNIIATEMRTVIATIRDDEKDIQLDVNVTS